MENETTKKTPAASQSLNTEIVPQENNLVNDYDIDAYLTKRKEFITKLGSKMVEGKDYHVIQGKKSLAKGGAEKIASIFGWVANFSKDEDAANSFAEIKGFIGFICTLSKAGNVVGEGRGGATLTKNNGDPNKTIKMAQKSAFIDAVLRSSGLSDLYSQDLEDMPSDTIKAHQTQDLPPNSDDKPKAVSEANKDKPATDKQKITIKGLMHQKGYTTLTEAGISKIENPTMQDASMIIKKLMTMPKKEEDVIQLDETFEDKVRSQAYVEGHEND